jgi:hypothetical protein
MPTKGCRVNDGDCSYKSTITDFMNGNKLTLLLFTVLLII